MYTCGFSLVFRRKTQEYRDRSSVNIMAYLQPPGVATGKVFKSEWSLAPGVYTVFSMEKFVGDLGSLPISQ